MAFCAICGAQRDSSCSCVDLAESMLRDTGIERRSKRSQEGFKELENAADRFMLKSCVMVAVLSIDQRSA